MRSSGPQSSSPTALLIAAWREYLVKLVGGQEKTLGDRRDQALPYLLTEGYDAPFRKMRSRTTWPLRLELKANNGN